MSLAVLGGGSWGTALAAHLRRAGHPVRLWLRDAATADEINRARRNAAYLPGIDLPADLEATPDLARAVGRADTVFVVIPSEFCRGVYRQLRAHAAPSSVIVSCTKGIEIDSLRRMTEVATEEAPGRALAVLSGPSFALEVARQQPTTVVVASAQPGVAEAVQRLVSTRSLKNVIAIAAGIVDGIGYGSNTVAALVTRGLAEIARLAVVLGARADTLSGLAGLGDLVLTCTGTLSRNRRVGQALGAGRSLAEAMAETRMVAEGVRTTLAACAMAERAGVEMPIAMQMREVLYRGRSPREAVEALMLRTLKRE
ncbi:MAG: glycerol-3-phosphate dehydrogenase [Acidobacteria bacterium]|nr:MAG: glycerol-3-phosphate dehydrogenase [Acidobacteriota bacterium]